MGDRIGFLLKRLLLLCLFLCLLGWIPGQAFAQENEGGDGDQFVLEEIVVTGSRIIRRDQESNSPIVTVDAAEFEKQTGLNVESYLNQLPEYNPASSPVTTANQDVQITPVNSVGVATISLRGFGPNRNLSLVNGKREVPVNALMWTDINGIPSSLIERVETISGGASAVYGADAVGGVTNFILKKNYEGFEFDVQYGVTEQGDGEETRISALLGANTADDRGNVTFGAEKYRRDSALERERDWYTDRWNDPNAAGYFFFLNGTNGYSCNPVCPNQGALKALFGGENPAAWYWSFGPDTAPYNSGLELKFNKDGTLWVQGNPIGESRSQLVKDGGLYASRLVFDNQDSSNTTTFLGTKYNRVQGYVSSPQDRYSIYGSGHYDLSDWLTVFAGAKMAESVTRTYLMGTSVITGWEATVPYNPTTDSPIDPTLDYTDAAVLAAVAADPAAYFAANPNPNFIPTGESGAGHPVPAELAWLLNSRSDPSARWQPQWYPENSLPGRQTYNTITTWQMEGGLNFEMPFRDWSGELYWSHGKSETYNVAGGNLSLQRYRALINYPDYARGAEGTGNMYYVVESENGREVVDTQRPAFGVGDFACTSGLYDTIFSDEPMSEDCRNALYAKLQTRTEMTQDIVELNLQGSVVDLPAGELRAALGYQYRKVQGEFNPDILQSQDSFQDQVVGVYPTGYLDAKTEVNDYYAEALIPVLSDLPFMKKLELEAGARFSSYDETDNEEWTYKVLASWTVKDWFRVRGGYNRATRSPNLGELFLNQQEIFTGGGNFGDPCSVRANAPWGAGGTTLAEDEVIGDNEGPPELAPGQTQAGADYTQQLCEAMMGTRGADEYYRGIVGGVDQEVDFTQQSGGGGFAWVLQEGNPLLDPEIADTWTLGFVLNSPFYNPWLGGITLGFDWYSIEIDDAIMTFSIDYANFNCFGTGAGLSPEEQAASPACQLVPRDQNNGVALNTTLSYDNQATIETQGFDIMFNWHADIAALVGVNVPGSVNLNVKATILDSYETRQSAAPYDVPIEWKGSLGPNLPGTQGGAYDYRLFTTLTYALETWSASLRWRHLPGVYTAGYAEQQALIANNARVAGGGDGIILGYTPTTEIETDSYDIFDLSGSWDINETFSVRLGITNLFNTDPTEVGSTAGYAPGSDLDVCNDAPGCSNPSSYSLPSTGGFNGGYYDTVGRRFFVGMKVRF